MRAPLGACFSFSDNSYIVRLLGTVLGGTIVAEVIACSWITWEAGWDIGHLCMRDNNRWHVRTFPARVDYKATNDYRDGNKRDISATKHYGLRKTGACDRAWLLGICICPNAPVGTKPPDFIKEFAIAPHALG